MTQSNPIRALAQPSQHGLRLMLASLLVAGASAFTMSAWSQGDGAHGMGGRGHGHGHGMMSGRMADHMLDGLNTTEAQRTQIKQIMQAARDDLKTQREGTRALRERSMQIFAAPSVDVAAAESVRQQLVQQHDASSRRMLQAMLDASRVLTPEQRAKLAERMQERSARMQERRHEHMQRHGADAQPK